MMETAFVAFATLFATIGPLDVAIVFASLTGDMLPARRTSTAIKGTVIATVILLFFRGFWQIRFGIVWNFDGRASHWRRRLVAADCHRIGLCREFRGFLDDFR